MRAYHFLLSVLIACPSIFGQQLDGSFQYLSLPYSPHVAATGGVNISRQSSNPEFIFQNPALLNASHHNKAMFGYMNYVSDINAGSAIYNRAIGQYGAWGVGINYLDYGSFTETTPEGVVLGKFSSSEMAIQGFYSHQLADNFRGGVTTKFLYSSMEQYNSVGLLFDLGINYYDPNKHLSLSAIVKNVGAVVNRYTETKQKIPWDIQLGISKKLKHAPFLLSLTLYHLNQWDLSGANNIPNTDSSSPQKDKVFNTIAKHVVLNVDFVPNDKFYISLGFNPKRQMDMSIKDVNGFSGFSLGAGINVKKVSMSASFYQQHIGGSSLMVGLTWNFNKNKL